VIEKVELLNQLAEEYDESFTHFMINSKVVSSTVSGNSRIALQHIPADTLIAIIGGVIVDAKDSYIAMPMGHGLYLHQVTNNRKGTVNHSCDPNCKISGLNKLVAKRDICINEELTIDYGGCAIGIGLTVIEKCSCGSSNCRGEIKTDDYKLMNIEDLNLYGKYKRGL
jgi:hypothetical protein|tara:strand:- start:307 stop:810 length:504 start_codon:yes stop_codon:yes gene_type:complete